ncbi:MAG: 16S rRNA (adenine(1518)-N(6)/adenine(1519)-N(6))-dimethyltransferase RsmA [bacterium]|nr:16S rRNA (adenine(1518)-N(6)/adenine(1519)-N(6))-dimethyltransferase RsmA [bacterium]
MPFSQGEDIYRLSYIRSLLAAHHIRPKQSLGQHFLHDRNVINKIVRVATLSPHDTVLEVGAGLGHLTLALAQTGARVAAVETDARLIPLLHAHTSAYKNLTVIHADILAAPLAEFCSHHKLLPRVIVANLPYNLTTSFVEDMVSANLPLRSATLTLQKEAAERLMSQPGERGYGPAGILLQLWGTPHHEAYVSPSCFFPPPSVNSSIVRIEAHTPPRVSSDLWPPLLRFVRALFQHRRKTILRALTPLYHSSHAASISLSALGISSTVRAENLPPEAFLQLCAQWYRHSLVST